MVIGYNVILFQNKLKPRSFFIFHFHIFLESCIENTSPILPSSPAGGCPKGHSDHGDR